MEYDVSQFESQITIWTIRGSLICMGTSCWLRLSQSNDPPRQLARLLWIVGALLSVAHFAAAMGFYHDWSHARAMDDTAVQTEYAIGRRVGIGIYFNYLFVIAWLTDAVWWVAHRSSYSSRAPWIGWLLIGYLLFIAFNGAVVFERGAVRWVSIFAFAVLAFAWFHMRNSRSQTKRKGNTCGVDSSN